MKAKLSFCYDHYCKFPNRNTGFIFNVNQCQCKHVFPLIVILKEILVLMCLASHSTLSRNEYWLLDIAKYIMRKKILNPFLCVEFRVLVEK